MVNGELVPLPTKISRDKHIFYFRLIPLLSEHVHNINTVFLEEAWRTTTLFYQSSLGSRRALEHYLGEDLPTFKTVFRFTQEDLPSQNLPVESDGRIMEQRK